jgi:hypothetical protein
VKRFPRALLPAAAAATALAVSGCGAVYDDAQAFIDAANAEGAGFELGPSLSTTSPDNEIYAITIKGAADPAEAREPGQAPLGGGSIIITPDDNAARAEYDECESAVSLLCYRAANVTLLLEDEIDPAVRDRVDEAISALASE